MKKFKSKINNKVLIGIELILSIILTSFMFIGYLDEEAGLILNNNVIYLPLIFSIVIIALFILEFFNTKPFIRLIILIFSFFICLLMNESIESLNATICLLSLIYLIACLIAFIIKAPIIIQYHASTGAKNCLPLGILSKKQSIMSKLLFLPTLIIMLIEFFLIENKYLPQVLIPSAILTFLITFIIYIKTSPINKILKCINQELSFEKFLNLINEIEASSILHPETYNFLQFVKANYYFTYDVEKGLELFETTKVPESKMYVDTYNIVKFEYLINKNDIDTLTIELQKYEQSKFHNQKYVNQLKYALDAYFSTNEIINIENIFQASGNKLRFQDCNNSFILMQYYEKRNNSEKAKYYAQNILDMHTDFKHYNEYAKSVIENGELKNEKN